MFLCNAEVEGVYEAQVPLWFRGVLKMGCISTVSKQSELTRNVSSKYFKLEELELVQVNSHPYLDHSVASFRRIFIYFAVDKSRNLGILSLFIIQSSNVEEIEIFKKKIAN
jgi:hypothetical protein